MSVSKTVKLLIVDDDETITDGLKIFFENKGKSVLTAYTKKEAEKIVRSHKDISRAIVDLVLDNASRIDGLDIVNEIKKYNKGAEVIVISALEDEGIYEELKRLGVKRFFKKPFDVEALPNEIL
jgi:DNA-binding NtrC family response regulator